MPKIIIYFSNKCHTCYDHISKMSKTFAFEQISLDEFPELYEEKKINIAPTTILETNGKEIARWEGMLFDKQHSEIRKLL